MAYTPLVELKKKKEARPTSYIPVSQLRDELKISSEPIRLQDDFAGSFYMSPPALASEGTISTIPFIGQTLKLAGQGTARAWSAFGARIAEKTKLAEGDLVNPKTFFGISPVAQKLGNAVFGTTTPFNLEKEDVETLTTFGVEPDVAKKASGGALTALLSIWDATPPGKAAKGVLGAIQALKKSTDVLEAARAMRTVNFAEDVIREYAPLFAKANTTKAVKETLESALSLQSKTTGRGYRPVAELRKEIEVVAPRLVDDTNPLATEARKYKSAEEFVKAETKKGNILIRGDS